MRSRLVVPIVVLLFLAPNLFASTFSFKLNSDNISPTENGAVQKFLQSSFEYLPAKMKERLPFTVSVHFLPNVDQKLVRVKGHEIQLNLSLKQQILLGSHQSGYNLAMASLLRGLAHVYDISGT